MTKPFSCATWNKHMFHFNWVMLMYNICIYWAKEHDRIWLTFGLSGYYVHRIIAVDVKSISTGNLVKNKKTPWFATITVKKSIPTSISCLFGWRKNIQTHWNPEIPCSNGKLRQSFSSPRLCSRLRSSPVCARNAWFQPVGQGETKRTKNGIREKGDCYWEGPHPKYSSISHSYLVTYTSFAVLMFLLH